MEIGKEEPKVFQAFTNEMTYTKNMRIPENQFQNIA